MVAEQSCVFILFFCTAQDEKQEDEERRDIKKFRKQVRKDKKDEDDARVRLKEMQIHLQVFGRFDEYMRTWAEDLGRPNFIMDKIWQMLQSNDTKTLNLTEDVEDLFGLGTTGRVVGADKAQGILD